MLKSLKKGCFYRLAFENGDFLEESNNYSSVEFLFLGGIPLLVCSLALIRSERGHKIIEVFHQKTGKRLGSFENVGNDVLKNIVKKLDIIETEKSRIDFDRIIEFSEKIKKETKRFKKKEKKFGIEFTALEVNFDKLEPFQEVKEIMQEKWGQEIEGTLAFNVAEDFLNLLYAFERDLKSKEKIKEILIKIENI